MPSASVAENQTQSALVPATHLNFYGLPGLVDMPTAGVLPDGELATTVSYFSGGGLRTTLSFQITPRLTGSFRYSRIDGVGVGGLETFDRSFDLHYLIWDERGLRPALAVGLRDLIGTGLYSSEYLVATKTITPELKASVGLGWGRLATRGGFTNPLGVLDPAFEVRPPITFGAGGTPTFNQWFRGDAAFFGGIEWRPNDKLALKLEYSSDAYPRETAAGNFTANSPFNFGIQYQYRPGINLGAYYLYGSEIGVSATFSLNPKRPPNKGQIHPGAPPLAVRAPGPRDLGWTTQANGPQILRANLTTLLGTQGIVLEGLSLEPRRARIHIENATYDAEAQAIGRTARVLAAALPASIETFEIVPVTEGIPAAAIILKRSDLEELEGDVDGTFKSFGRARIVDAAVPATDLIYADGRYPRFEYGLGPYVASALFDPDNPVRLDAGLELTARYDITPGLILSGAIRAKAFGNLNTATRVSDSILPHVRSDFALYDKTDVGLEHLTLEYFGRPGPDLYSRVTFGYLEEMFGGISGEILWKPVHSRLGLGLELNYVKQRDFDKKFGFQDYDVITGHASAYYDFGNGFEGQLDVGRYLAGDWGATFTLERTFRNGWKVGAFATFTDVSFEDFGEGSFDKGLTFTIPSSWFTGRPSRRESTTVIRPIQRDGGARLDVRNRLHDLVADYHGSELRNEWGLFWR